VRDTNGTERRPPESLTRSTGDEPEREELLAVCKPIARRLKTTLTAAVERVSTIPASDGYLAKHFADPKAKGISVEWVRAALGRARELAAEQERLERLVPE
jgi:hypothetical protein